MVKENAISIKKLHKTYLNKVGKKINAINNLSLDIPKGSCCALIGPNGAGKSTLINILIGITNKDSGEIKILNLDLNTQINKIKKNIGLVQQELKIDVFIPIYEFLCLYSGYYGIGKKERKVEEILKMLSLWEYRNNTARTLSGGMKRRFLIAKALLHNPEILILDEPTAGVDIKLRDQIWNNIKNIEQQGKTIILTSHYMQEVESLCNYFIFMNQGKIIAKGEKNKFINVKLKQIVFELSREMDSILPEMVKYKMQLDKTRKFISVCLENKNINNVLNIFIKNNILIDNIDIKNISLEKIFKDMIN